MVYLLKMVIFHAYVSHNQMVNKFSTFQDHPHNDRELSCVVAPPPRWP